MITKKEHRIRCESFVEGKTFGLCPASRDGNVLGVANPPHFSA
jgi:hypothetical protein